MKSQLYYNLKVVFTYSGVTPYFPYANTPLSHLGLGSFSVLSQMMQLSTEAMISIQTRSAFCNTSTVKSFILLAGISSFALCPQNSFRICWGRKWDYIKGILTITLEFLTRHADEQYWISSRIPSLCVIPQRLYHAELLPRGNTAKRMFHNWQQISDALSDYLVKCDPGQLNVCDYASVLIAGAFQSQLDPVLNKLLQKTTVPQPI